ncbi:MAG: CaiB/BaiF CoA-transferase family protein [Actinomycetota bacterium]|nr:CaiB/BaiF CoA-transferase family protein [Actinomycetota bacterium]MED5174188.1 CaiB/BaiF CoA-transferase family protein [Actinomycetota bacterium]
MNEASDTPPASPENWEGGPLSGVRVIDLSAVVSGPFGTSILADQGADVIVVEQAGSPDIVRSAGPLAESAQGVSAFFAAMNRNKRSIALDLKTERGKMLLKSLVAVADVVVQNFRPGALERLGMGWDVLSEINPQLIMCSVSGFGTDGPYSHRPAFDPIVQAVAGYPMVQVDDDGVPHLMATIVCDKVTSLNVAQSVCAALVGRGHGAGGQHIELAMVDASVHFLWPEAMWNYTYLDHETDMPDLSTIYKLFATSDGYAMVYPVATEAHWQGMCSALGRDDLASDPRFGDLQGRVLYGGDVNDELERETVKFTTTQLVALMDKADVPVAPVNTREAMIVDPHIQHRGLIVESVHPTAGRVRSVRPPARFSATPSGAARPAPMFGQHTDEVLSELLGLEKQELSELRREGVTV